MGSLISMPSRQGETSWREHVAAVGVDAGVIAGQEGVDRRLAVALALRGGVALLFGLLALLWPGVTLVALALLFAAYLFVDGAAMMAAAIARHPWREEPRWQYLLAGLAGVLIAFMTLLWPQITALTFVILAGAWAVVTGLLEMVVAVTGLLEAAGSPRLHQALIGESLFALAGMASVVVGILILMRPDAGAVALATVLGAFALIVGVVLVAAAWQLRKTPASR